MHRITRIVYNTDSWKKPSGMGGKAEAKGTYANINGFGHEEWLFRDEWRIDGWRYAFVEGVRKSMEPLLRYDDAFDLTLFTLEPDTMKRRYVAFIESVECLTKRQAEEAVKIFKANGWYDQMLNEIDKIGGNKSALGAVKWKTGIVNIRYRLDKLKFYLPGVYADTKDPMYKWSRCNLYNAKPGNNLNLGDASHIELVESGNSGAEVGTRKGSGAVQVTYEHRIMQDILKSELRKEHPKAKVETEDNCVDVSVRSSTEHVLYEIKTDLAVREVIRQALGQILEYAYHLNYRRDPITKLVIVGRGLLQKEDRKYFEVLKSKLSVPLEYRTVPLPKD